MTDMNLTDRVVRTVSCFNNQMRHHYKWGAVNSVSTYVFILFMTPDGLKSHYPPCMCKHYATDNNGQIGVTDK